MRKVIAVLGLSVVLLGACGGGDDDNDVDTAGATTIAGASATTSGGGGGGGGKYATFCGFRSGFTPPNPGAASGDMKTSFQQAKEALDKAADNAPSEIRDDVRTIATAYAKFYAALEKANYDYSKVDPNEMQSIATAEVQAAGQRITEWVNKNCT